MSLIVYPIASDSRAFSPSAFAISSQANQRAFASPFGGSEQVVDLLNDRWSCTLDLPPCEHSRAAKREAFIEAMRGQTNRTELYHFGRPQPLGTAQSSAGLVVAAAQGAASLQIATTAGATLLAGDMLGVDGLLLRCAADCTANGNGLLTVPLTNRLRRAVAGLARATTATFVDGAGVLQTAGVNVPRFQGGQLLVEGAATNCLIQTDTHLTDWDVYLTGTAEVSRSVVFDPFFGNVFRLTKTAGAVGHRAGIRSTLVGMSGQSYVASSWVKRGALATGRTIYVDAHRIGGGVAITASAIMNDLPVDVWTRASAIGSSVDGLAGGGFGYVWLDGPVGTTVDVKLPNVTIGSVLSSAFPAGGSSATRAADIVRPVTLNRPTAPFRLASTPRMRYVAGYAEGLTLDFVEMVS